jgi:hypothetical protein
MNIEDRILNREMETVLGVVANMPEKERKNFNSLNDSQKKAYLKDKYRVASQEGQQGKFTVILLIIGVVLFLIKAFSA